MEAALKELTILYVEDEEPVRHNIAMALKRRVGKVITAENGKEGLDKTQEYNPDVIITDLEMPVMNGIVMIQKIREIYGPNRPIIVITAYKDEEHYTDLADGYLFKPVLFDKLEKMIADLVKKHKKGISDG
jgi:YesN/AraC family two-component response regulator